MKVQNESTAPNNKDKSRTYSYQKNKKTLCKTLILLILFLTPIACSKADKKQTEEPTKATESVTVENDQNLECQYITDTYCTACHQESRVCQKLGKKNLGQWNRTIKRMIKHGAKLNNNQKDALAECLANQSDSITRACE